MIIFVSLRSSSTVFLRQNGDATQISNVEPLAQIWYLLGQQCGVTKKDVMKKIVLAMWGGTAIAKIAVLVMCNRIQDGNVVQSPRGTYSRQDAGVVQSSRGKVGKMPALFSSKPGKVGKILALFRSTRGSVGKIATSLMSPTHKIWAR